MTAPPFPPALLALLLRLLRRPRRSPGRGPRPAAGLDARVPTLASAGADEAYRLALDLEAAGRTDLAARAYERVLEVEPGHRAARRALGYEEVDGTVASRGRTPARAGVPPLRRAAG